MSMETNDLIEKAAGVMRDDGMLTIRVFQSNGCWLLKINGQFVVDADNRGEMLRFISAAALKASVKNR